MSERKTGSIKDDEVEKAVDTSEAKQSTSSNENVKDRSSPQNSSSSSPPPNLSSIPANMSHRPPSATPSVHSNNSGGGTRTTATSRRGGRTRSRSPPMVDRASPNHDRSYPPHPSETPHSPSNPSSAAAAAAAAAKALSSNPGAQFRDDRHHRDAAYEGHFRSSRSWPPEDHDRSRRSESYGNSQSIHRLPRGGGDYYSRRGHAASYSGNDNYRARHGHGMHPSYDEDRRYGQRLGRGRTPPPGDRYGQHYYRESITTAHADGRSSPHGTPAPPSSQRNRAGGMTRVIGTATPIHVPRATEPPPSRHSRAGTPASVFRGRPGADAHRRGDRSIEEDDTPQKVLLSLRTPTTSFDEKQPAKSKKGDDELPLSPDEPPQIQHAHRKNASSDFFDPSRSPKGSIEMAPSFNLFNQSFDSFGDTFNVVGNLDATLQSTSFGAGPSTSGDLGVSLQQTLSGSNIAQQLLGSSGSGGLTFGMSPVNSFGNGGPSVAGPSSRRGSGNMMVLGGNERSTSPTQVLGMYHHSYSGDGSHGVRGTNSMGGPLEDSHLRMSGGSFGAPSLSHNYTRSFGGFDQSPVYPGRMGHSHDGQDGGQFFYVFLKRHKAAFQDCSFLLPGLKTALLEAPLSSTKSDELGDDEMKRSMSHGGVFPEPSLQDISLARRRVASAVCAFGGTSNSGEHRASSHEASSDKVSIFRETEEPSTVTPSSSASIPYASCFQTQAKLKYDEMLSGRYYENENRLSWEFEENPPVQTPSAEDREKEKASEKAESEAQLGYTADCSEADQKLNDCGEDDEEVDSSTDNKDLTAKAENDTSPSAPATPSRGNDSPEKRASATSPGSGDQPKMKYRCKLCGQPKQNHTCPFMQSLARSIGVNVYPAVNAFTAAEPGVVAPPLSEMNNFVMSDDCSVADSKASGVPTPERRMNGSTQVTPESRRSKAHHMASPTSTLSAGSATPQRARTPASGRNRSSSAARNTPGSSSRSRKRRHGQMHGGGADDQADLLFVEPMELRSEQFKTITPSKNKSPDAYKYPALPLPYAQRKRLSDNLFSLSQKVPQLTKECSAVLREAREKDMWDLAVAELMTQVVVVIHCHDGDSRFEGLRHYLLTLGIAC